jgi:hypothetical protein
MSTEYGIFEHDTDLVEGGFHGHQARAAAEKIAVLLTDADNGDTPYTVAEICPEHAERRHSQCEECAEEAAAEEP